MKQIKTSRTMAWYLVLLCGFVIAFVALCLLSLNISGWHARGSITLLKHLYSKEHKNRFNGLVELKTNDKIEGWRFLPHKSKSHPDAVKNYTLPCSLFGMFTTTNPFIKRMKYWLQFRLSFCLLSKPYDYGSVVYMQDSSGCQTVL